MVSYYPRIGQKLIGQTFSKTRLWRGGISAESKHKQKIHGFVWRGTPVYRCPSSRSHLVRLWSYWDEPVAWASSTFVREIRSFLCAANVFFSVQEKTGRKNWRDPKEKCFGTSTGWFVRNMLRKEGLLNSHRSQTSRQIDEQRFGHNHQQYTHRNCPRILK